ncbi:putative signal peptidase-like protein 12 kDa [Umbelopsis sp. PMI_123]|nr:putative signal peptidase-like protein 12 kDa [Umbelopsis sp. PMI_123]
MSLADYLECNIDFEGQRLAELISQVILTISAIIGFLYGYVQQSLEATVLIFGVGFAITLLVTLPPWPFYNRHPVKWVSTQDEKTNDRVAS